jgi:HK97 family phage major capsid protein
MNGHFRMRGLVAAYANAPGARSVLSELQASFDDFRTRHDTRIDKLEHALDDVNAVLAAVRVGGAGVIDEGEPAKLQQSRQALASFLKTGKMPQAALRTDSDPDGGYTVDRVLSDEIQKRRLDMSPLGRLARRVTISVGDAFEEPWDIGDIGANWVGEREPRPALNTTNLAMLKWPVFEIYTIQPATQRILDDSSFDIAGWLEGSITDKFARSEGAAFISGDGIMKPRGLLSYDMVDASSWQWGKFGYIASGVAAALTDSTHNGADALTDLVYSLRAPYRANARWLMNSKTAAAIRKLKSKTEELYLWSNPISAGQPATLLGYPVEMDETMPDIGADKFPVAFGDFQRGYLVVEKPGVRMLRDPFTSKPFVLFYAYRRVGGGAQDFDAVKFLKIATS